MPYTSEVDASQPKVRAAFPEPFMPLFEPHRYKVLYGGRGGAKSWGAARALLLQGRKKKLRVLCTREYQNTLSDSSHQLLADQIVELGLQDFYKVQANKIVGANDTKFRFYGLRRQFNEIASFEGIDIVWAEEAVMVSKASWRKLIPTIRKDGSEIWVTFNPELEDDDTYQRFVVHPPPDTFLRKVTWQHNPWFPPVLNQERVHDRSTLPEDEYLHIWEGHCLRELEGAIFAHELRTAENEGRITKVPAQRGVPVDTTWDLGRSDLTSIWFRQRVGLQWRYVDFYEDNGHDITHYAQVLRKLDYVYGEHYLPHDGDYKLIHHPDSLAEQLKKLLGSKSVHVVPRPRLKADGINASRTLFASCWFDTERCADGLQHLRHAKYAIDPHTRRRSIEPVKDQHLHAADAFQTGALTRGPVGRPKLDLDVPATRKPTVLGDLRASSDWMM